MKQLLPLVLLSVVSVSPAFAQIGINPRGSCFNARVHADQARKVEEGFEAWQNDFDRFKKEYHSLALTSRKYLMRHSLEKLSRYLATLNQDDFDLEDQALINDTQRFILDYDAGDRVATRGAEKLMSSGLEKYNQRISDRIREILKTEKERCGQGTQKDFESFHSFETPASSESVR